MCQSTKRTLCSDNQCQKCHDKSFASSKRAACYIEDRSKNPMPARQMFKCSHAKAWFRCDKCSHEFDAALYHVTGNDRWCPYCAQKKLCTNQDCQMCFDNSFASSKRAQFYIDHRAKNPLTAREMLKRSGTKAWFRCDTCPHEFDVALNNVTGQDSWCPYCAQKKLCDNQECRMCFDNSFASSKRAACFIDDHSKNPLTARQMFKSSNAKAWFRCDKCPHEFDAALNDVTCGDNWCPYCARQKLCISQECQVCLDNSFASSKRAAFFIDDRTKNPLTARQMFKSSNAKAWFLCDKCPHEFVTQLCSVTCGDRWCPMCKKKSEQRYHQLLLTIVPSAVNRFAPEWCRSPLTNHHLPFDFLVALYNKIHELDGNHHRNKVSNWPPPLLVQLADVYKMKRALEHGFSVVRVRQQDYWTGLIGDEEVQALMCTDPCPTIMYVARDPDFYTEHKRLMKLDIEEVINMYRTEHAAWYLAESLRKQKRLIECTIVEIDAPCSVDKKLKAF